MRLTSLGLRVFLAHRTEFAEALRAELGPDTITKSQETSGRLRTQHYSIQLLVQHL